MGGLGKDCLMGWDGPEHLGCAKCPPVASRSQALIPSQSWMPPTTIHPLGHLPRQSAVSRASLNH